MQPYLKQRNLTTFCNNVIFLRAAHNISKKELATIIGVKQKTLTRIENGDVPPRLSTLVIVRLAQHFHLKMYQLFLPLYLWNKKTPRS